MPGYERRQGHSISVLFPGSGSRVEQSGKAFLSRAERSGVFIAARHACSWGPCALRDEGRERKEAQARRVCASRNHLV